MDEDRDDGRREVGMGGEVEIRGLGVCIVVTCPVLLFIIVFVREMDTLLFCDELLVKFSVHHIVEYVNYMIL